MIGDGRETDICHSQVKIIGHYVRSRDHVRIFHQFRQSLTLKVFLVDQCMI